MHDSPTPLGVSRAPFRHVTLAVLLAIAVLSSIGATARARSAESSPCALCAGSEKVKCPECRGHGTASFPCVTCRDVEGIFPCLRCSAPRPAGTAGKPAPKIVAGRAPCPNRLCREGRVRWDVLPQPDKCLYCGGRGAVDCRTCRDGRFPCSACDGKRKRTGPCLACRATGSLPCPLCRVTADAAKCASCDDAPAAVCKKCDAKGLLDVPCPVCRGTNETSCAACLGTKRKPCQDCAATGNIRVKLIDPKNPLTPRIGGKKQCEKCRGKGSVACDSDKGRCWLTGTRRLAHRDGRIRVHCDGCSGMGRVRCAGCMAPKSRALETAARVLSEAGYQIEALALLRAAPALADAWLRDRRAEAESDGERAESSRIPDSLKESERIHASDVARLREAIRAAEERAKTDPKSNRRDLDSRYNPPAPDGRGHRTGG
jgi:hypothetical protein